MSEPQQTTTPAGLIAVAWTLVGVPLAYGLFQTSRVARGNCTPGLPQNGA